MNPVAKSPIRVTGSSTIVHGWEVSNRQSSAALRLSDVTPLAKVLIKSDAHSRFAASHPIAFGQVRVLFKGVLEIGCDPGAWLLVGSVGTASDLVATATTSTADVGEFISVIDITHGRAMMRLSGVDSPRLLNKICAIDLSDSVTPNHSAFRSSVAKLVTDVIRDDLADSTRSYLIHCERSSGQHLFDCILDAGIEFGIDVDGAVLS